MPNAVVEERCDAPSRVDGALQLSTAVFRQMNKEKPRTHHDALEFPDGQTVLLLERQEYSSFRLNQSRPRRSR